jgi:hypothetical protein
VSTLRKNPYVLIESPINITKLRERIRSEPIATLGEPRFATFANVCHFLRRFTAKTFFVISTRHKTITLKSILAITHKWTTLT